MEKVDGEVEVMDLVVCSIYHLIGWYGANEDNEKSRSPHG